MSRQGTELELEEQVLDVLARWDQRLEAANAAWADLPATCSERSTALPQSSHRLTDEGSGRGTMTGR